MFLRILTRGVPTIVASATRASLSIGYTRKMLVHIPGYSPVGIVPMGCAMTVSKSRFPIRCCIMVAMKASMAIPVAILAVSFVMTHLAAFRPSGEIRTASATMCSQANGRAIVLLSIGMSISTLVSG